MLPPIYLPSLLISYFYFNFYNDILSTEVVKIKEFAHRKQNVRVQPTSPPQPNWHQNIPFHSSAKAYWASTEGEIPCQGILTHSQLDIGDSVNMLRGSHAQATSFTVKSESVEMGPRPLKDSRTQPSMRTRCPGQFSNLSLQQKHVEVTWTGDSDSVSLECVLRICNLTNSQEMLTRLV